MKSTPSTRRADRIGEQLAALEPSELLILNESDNHSVPPNSETHFRVVVVAQKFIGLPRLKRHRQVQAALKAEFDSGLHALAIEALTPEEWSQKNGPAVSPDCRGGSQ